MQCRCVGGEQLKTRQEGGGWTTRSVVIATEEENDYGWDLHMPPATAGVMVRDVAMPLSPLTDDGDNYDNVGDGRHDKRGGTDILRRRQCYGG